MSENSWTKGPWETSMYYQSEEGTQWWQVGLKIGELTNEEVICDVIPGKTKNAEANANL